MRVGRVRGATTLEGRNEMRRFQRALAAREAQVERIRSAALDEFRQMLAILRETTALAAERAECLEDFCRHQADRFDVLARVHATMLRDSGLVDFETLVWNELSAVVSPAEEDRLTIAGPSVLLERRTAELLALALHELTTNAIKFGGFAEGHGSVEVTWDVVRSEAPSLDFMWIEKGPRALDRLPSRRGFGRELIENVLPSRLAATTCFSLSASGVRCEIEAPLRGARIETPKDMAVAA